jgi:uncharacterized membrane protein YfcA
MRFLAIGLAAGILSGLFGIGGGIVIVPALIMLAAMKPTEATGTSLAALLLPVGALGAWQYYRQGALDLRAALWIAAGLFLGAWLGARLALRMPTRELQRGFALFLLVVAAQLWRSAR